MWLASVAGSASGSRGPARAASVCGFHVPQVRNAVVFDTVRLIRNDGRWHYEFPVHEYLTTTLVRCAVVVAFCFCFCARRVLTPVGVQTDEKRRLFDDATLAELRHCQAPNLARQFKAPLLRLRQERASVGLQLPERRQRDLALLAALVEREPDNPRAIFYLANAHYRLGRLREAKRLYLRRIAMMESGWWEERETSMVLVVQISRVLNEHADMRDFAMRLFYNHQRIEGIMELARHALDNENLPSLCFGYADLACQVLRPVRSLFIDYREYDVYRWKLRSGCRELALNPDESLDEYISKVRAQFFRSPPRILRDMVENEKIAKNGRREVDEDSEIKESAKRDFSFLIRGEEAPRPPA